MSLFNTILGAIDNPEREASSNQIGSIINTIQSLSQNNNANPDSIQTAMSVIGKYARSSLQQKRQAGGEEAVNSIVNQYGGTQANNQIINILFSTPQVQQMVGEIAQRTGLPAGTIQSMLPLLVPLVLNFLKTGKNNQNPLASNPVLSQFLDADGDGDVDLADAMQLASRYMKK
ncbi:MAG: DUF937 domain-containing protein [Jaaginema sp. PMC 1079.18]|nr:DUF937 domain-containing protein [Jaaginema sp. PMC 1080.18]MEC4850357.1 DUF937 domain-containing protein [Jaaginema sp. PMC 1079.18]MEC4867155.1 DUF937 domain-containing protein [Jaaginema sp. PMC 1078.18]